MVSPSTPPPTCRARNSASKCSLCGVVSGEKTLILLNLLKYQTLVREGARNTSQVLFLISIINFYFFNFQLLLPAKCRYTVIKALHP